MAQAQVNRQQQRPQGQQQKQPPLRILRIGIVLGGSIIEERLCRKRETITLGQSSNNSFSIPIEGLPKSFPIFAYENEKYFLHFTDNMDGRISSAGNLQTLAQIKQQGAKKRGQEWVIPLGEHARGKISVGSMDLLFQFVTAPPLQPRPRLPASVRGSIADRIEPRLAIILAMSILTHFGVAGWAYFRDVPKKSPVERAARSFQAKMYELEKKEPIVVIEPTETGEEDTQAEPAGTKDKTDVKKPQKDQAEPTGGDKPSGEDSPPGENSDSDADAAIDEEIANNVVIGVLTGGGSEEGIFGQMSGTDQGSSLDSSISHAKGKSTSTKGTGTGRQRSTKSGKLGTGKGQKVGSVGAGKGTGTKVEEKITSRAKLGGADDLSISDLDPASVIKRIRSKYMAGMKRCHQRILKIDPKASGKVKIRFKVGPTGRVTKAKVKGFDPTFDACIKGQASKWRFSAPKDDGKPTSADFEISPIFKPGG